MCETLSSFIEVKYICQAIKLVEQDYIKCNDKESLAKFHNLSITFSFSLQMNGLLQSGESLNDVISSMLGSTSSMMIEYGLDGNYKNGPRLSMIGANCSPPEAIDLCLHSLTDESIDLLNKYNIGLVVYANRTMPKERTGWALSDGNSKIPTRTDMPESLYFEKYIKQWINNKKFGSNVKMVGGCCRMFPSYIEYISKNLKSNKQTVSKL